MGGALAYNIQGRAEFAKALIEAIATNRLDHLHDPVLLVWVVRQGMIQKVRPVERKD